MYLTYLFNQDTFKANVKVPKCSANKKNLLAEHEWRSLGITQRSCCQHYGYVDNQPHVLLFRVPEKVRHYILKRASFLQNQNEEQDAPL